MHYYMNVSVKIGINASTEADRPELKRGSICKNCAGE